MLIDKTGLVNEKASALRRPQGSFIGNQVVRRIKAQPLANGNLSLRYRTDDWQTEKRLQRLSQPPGYLDLCLYPASGRPCPWGV